MLGVDIWSLGCILGELMQTRPVFYCKNDDEVLDRAFRMMGTPTTEHCAFLTKLKKWKNYKHYDKPSSLKDFFPYGTPAAIDLLEKMLNIDPKQRITAKEALAHPFLAE